MECRVACDSACDTCAGGGRHVASGLGLGCGVGLGGRWGCKFLFEGFDRVRKARGTFCFFHRSEAKRKKGRQGTEKGGAVEVKGPKVPRSPSCRKGPSFCRLRDSLVVHPKYLRCLMLETPRYHGIFDTAKCRRMSGKAWVLSCVNSFPIFLISARLFLVLFSSSFFCGKLDIYFIESVQQENSPSQNLSLNISN